MILNYCNRNLLTVKTNHFHSLTDGESMWNSVDTQAVVLETLCGCRRVVNIPIGCDEWKMALIIKNIEDYKYATISSAKAYYKTRLFRYSGMYDNGIKIFQEVAE